MGVGGGGAVLSLGVLSTVRVSIFFNIAHIYCIALISFINWIFIRVPIYTIYSRCHSLFQLKLYFGIQLRILWVKLWRGIMEVTCVMDLQQKRAITMTCSAREGLCPLFDVLFFWI